MIEPKQQLPVLEAIINVVSTSTEFINFDNIGFVCVQHLLYTTFNLVEALKQLGASTNNIHIIGKPYSSCQEVVDLLTASKFCYHQNCSQKMLGGFLQSFKKDINNMWKSAYQNFQAKNIKLIVVLDDGGHCLINIPEHITKKYQLVGIEQTTSGLTHHLINSLSFPVIEVASSAAKQLIEPPMIAEAVVKKLVNIMSITNKSCVCAVVGLGVIGIAIVYKLVSLGYQVITYDKKAVNKIQIEGITYLDNFKELIVRADYIFGCTGEDITNNLDINIIEKDKTFISCSSYDKEFLSLLKIIKQNNYTCDNILDHIYYQLPNHKTITILRGGFPINLDNSGESVEAKDIQLTRGLLLGGILQGLLCAPHYFKKVNNRIMLNPVIQSFVVKHWMLNGSNNLFSSEVLDKFQDYDWITERSGGVFHDNKHITKIFINNTSN